MEFEIMWKVITVIVSVFGAAWAVRKWDTKRFDNINKEQDKRIEKMTEQVNVRFDKVDNRFDRLDNKLTEVVNTFTTKLHLHDLQFKDIENKFVEQDKKNCETFEFKKKK